MDGVDIRGFCDDYLVARRALIDSVTEELRSVYRPIAGKRCIDTGPIHVFVALQSGDLVDTVDCLLKDNHVHIQGVALHPAQRRRGICLMWVNAAMRLAIARKMPVLTLSTIEATGNVRIFQNRGLK